ncbi:MAG: hypothetical protein Q4F75_00885 [Pseudomonadota bacterium]|nr:hypothetical protein [Pseudomonadota bacterium]
MNINFKFLLCGAAVWLFSQYAAAQCAETDCLKLGYTKLQKCDGGLKCPFGEYWACPKVEEKAVLGECTGYAKNCSIGQILNSDGTCSNDKVSGKTPIAVVVYIGDDNCGQALALKDLGIMYWSKERIDVPDLPNYTNVLTAEKDFDSCGNTQKIIKYGDANMYPPAWAAANYAPSTVVATKGKWCLPAAGVARSMMNNYDKINSGLLKAGGESLPSLSNHDHRNWSSSEYSRVNAWKWCYACNELSVNNDKSYDYHVRPVLAF